MSGDYVRGIMFVSLKARHSNATVCRTIRIRANHRQTSQHNAAMFLVLLRELNQINVIIIVIRQAFV